MLGETERQPLAPFDDRVRQRAGLARRDSQSVEQAASPLTAFLIGPFTQFVAIPFMTTGAGAELIGLGPELLVREREEGRYVLGEGPE